ncbi:hypothetical protein C8J57DRAFT_1465737 [Mycena rebaudengoi]|nr:hypothetical protein C8J57DRAFT_1465737 [Mycena rebaudengoi]
MSFVRYPTLAETGKLYEAIVPTLSSVTSTSKMPSKIRSWNFGFDLDDEIVVQMARAWPNIEKLNLLPKFDQHDSVDVTLDGLRAFAQYCPQFKTIGICVNATEPAPMSGIPMSQRSLTQLDVGCSAIWRAKSAAAFIVGHFSEVHSVTARFTPTTKDRASSGGLWTGNSIKCEGRKRDDGTLSARRFRM